MAVHKKRLHVFGGMTANGPTNDLWSYDAKMNVWAQRRVIGESPPPRSDASGVIYDGCMWVFGGHADDPAGRLWRLDMKAKCWSIVDGTGTEVPASRKLHSASVFENTMYMFGGERLSDGAVLDEMWTFDFARQTWERIPLRADGKAGSIVPPPRFGHATVVIGKRWLIHGGRSEGGDPVRHPPLECSYLFNVKKRTWSKLPSTLAPFCQASRWGHRLELIRPKASGKCMLLTGGLTVTTLPLQ
eukprot:GHVO01027121.1.p1 GENE.GHVO01027121.1~~GHVO01027121.1.p1  ORF type:complete len:259 (-),score=22.96 GHVO01027121.1:167-898(-)